MIERPRPRGAMRRLLGSLLFAGVGVLAAPANDPVIGDAEADTDDVVSDVVDATLDLAGEGDAAAGGAMLAILLDTMHPFDALRTAAIAAQSPRVEVRHALAEALTRVFPLAADDVVLEHLVDDDEPAVRVAALHASRVRGVRHV